ncbi:MAG TPA: MqnA/MqnD/SBP family protein, partial [Flavitalea sp.]|nr:MqnA/MqnD/SBP family protein [Flavitalea sp.]
MKKIKVGIVNYLNTLPLLSGIERSPVMSEIELVKDYPSKIAASLMDGSIDIGLVPVAIIPNLTDWYINTDYCIGCDGAVASVCIFSDVPLEEADSVLLDYQSRTSVQLATLLLKEYYKVKAI